MIFISIEFFLNLKKSFQFHLNAKQTYFKKKNTIVVANLSINEFTYSRFNSLLGDLQDKRKKNIDSDDLLNELIDNFQQNNWDHDVLSGG
jgi:hypothetical protein